MSELRAAGDEISRMTWALIRYKLKMKGLDAAAPRE
jgi:hypothetical protein